MGIFHGVIIGVVGLGFVLTKYGKLPVIDKVTEIGEDFIKYGKEKASDTIKDFFKK